jgi:drug/metabolite transporter (DMT)-like permease
VTSRPDLWRGLIWLAIAIGSWGAMFSVAKRTLPVLDAFFLGSFRYAFGVMIFIAILWAAEGRRAPRYGGRALPAALFGVLGFNNGVKYLGALNTMLMLNLVPVIVFAIEARLGRSYTAIELAGAAVVIGALVANNLFLRWQAAPR